ncbi:MAG TPA: DUF6089 family protein [Saprospiraceae bacterium]|nr:DUF6089 family protein [Saprospiraceae bacterium]
MKQHLTLLCFLFCIGALRAQTNIDFGLSGGLAVYSGDLSPREVGFSFEDIGPATSVFLRFQFKDWIGLRTSLSYAYLNADDRRSGNLFRDLSFQTNIYEASGILEISPTNIGYYDSKAVFVPYLAIGVGLFGFNPKTMINGELVELRPIGTEGQGLPNYDDYYSNTSLNFPFGLGVKIVVSDRLSFGVDVIGRKLQTDYLDDVSGTSVRYGDILENKGELAARLSNPNLPLDTNPDRRYTRGGTFNDFYYMATVNFAYRIQSGRTVYKPGKKGVVCPRF